jgi:hypothetical protein
MTDIPYFPFYASDWLGDEKVQLMSLAAEGAYIHLLSIQWREGSIPADRSAIVLLCKGQDGPHIDEVIPCFRKAPRKPGRLYNPRLESERKKLEGYRKAKKTAGIMGAEKRWHSHDSAIDLPLIKNGSSSLSSYKKEENKNSPPGRKFHFEDRHLNLAKFLESAIKENVPFHALTGKAYLESWANSFRLMEKKIPFEKIKAVLEWSQEDSFWKINILSADTFREKFGRLEAKAAIYEAQDGEVKRGRGMERRPQTDEEKRTAADRKRKLDEHFQKLSHDYTPKIDEAQKRGDKKRADELRSEANAAMESFSLSLLREQGGQP